MVPTHHRRRVAEGRLGMLDAKERALLRCCPLRVEGLEEGLTFCFRHKSLQEFYTARALLTQPLLLREVPMAVEF